MKRWIIILPLIFLCSCQSKKDTSWFSAGKAAEYFSSVEDICNKDDGRMWGENLYGPVMYINARTRTIYANVQDKDGSLKSRDGIYTGILPKERWISNTSILFGGVTYAMVPLPKEEDHSELCDRTIHSLYHSYQTRHGLSLSTFNTRHLNDKNARLYLKLEWKALINAITSSGDLRDEAIRDALVFRGARRELFPGSIIDENEFENNEGLTTFTYMKLSSSDNEELTSKLLAFLNRIYNNTSYAYGYGFIHGALYAYLLDCKDFDFTQIRSLDFDLGKATSGLYGIELPERCRDIAGSLALNYDLKAIQEEEKKHDEIMKEKKEKIISLFTERPVLFLQMESPNFSFEPEDMNALDTMGTLYNRLRVSDNWGKLIVDEGGALVTNDLKTLRVSARDITMERNHVSGEGWQLILNDGWQASENGGNYAVRKQLP